MIMSVTVYKVLLQSYRCLLHLMNIMLSNFSAVSLVRSGLNILPAVLNILSTGADEAGIDRTRVVSSKISGNFRKNNGTFPE